MPFIHHDLRTVVAELTTKIEELQASKAYVQGKLDDSSRDADMNRAALEAICVSLEAAKNGKLLLMNSCCSGQNCDIEYAD